MTSGEIHHRDARDGALLDAWERWRGAVDCAETRRLWSADQLRAEADAMAAQIRSVCPNGGERVGIALGNSAAFPVALMATLQAGCHPVLLSATATSAELAAVVRQYRLRGWIRAREAPNDAACAPFDGGPIPLGWVEGESAGTAHAAGTALTVLHATSGTYGRASFCLRDPRVAVAEGRNFIDAIGCYDAARVVITTPLNHAYAYGFGLVASLLTHSTLVLAAAFNPRQFFAREARQRSQIVALVPPMARVFANIAAGDDRASMPAHVFFAGAPCSPQIAGRFRDAFGVEMDAIYGTTETGAIATTYGVGAAAGAVGRVLGGVEVSLRDRAAYASLGADVGEVCVRSTSMMQGYADVETRWAAEGVFGTGDLGTLDGVGHLHLVGRIKDMINLGGTKVDPAAVEQVLLAHPSVSDAAVYPGLRPDGSEFVQAAIAPVGSAPVDAGALRVHCAAVLDAFRVPTAFHQVDQIPRTASGKCLKIRCPNFPASLRAQGPPRDPRSSP